MHICAPVEYQSVLAVTAPSLISMPKEKTLEVTMTRINAVVMILTSKVESDSH